MTSLLPDLASGRARAIALMRSRRSLVVALSGGVDSAVLLALALEALGPERVLAVTGLSPSLPSHELEDARAVARAVGATHEVVETHEMDRPGYRANAGDRCYHCRSELFGVLRSMAESRGIEAVAYGAIRDDSGDFRPGMAAARELGVLAPLLEAGIGKSEVRALAREAGLPVREKPASACLSSRIPVGTEVTPGRLAQVERAEAALRKMGFQQFRVRHHGEVARLELDAEGLRQLLDPSQRSRVVAAVRVAGFRFVAVDLEGYRSGSLNPEPLAPGRPGVEPVANALPQEVATENGDEEGDSRE